MNLWLTWIFLSVALWKGANSQTDGQVMAEVGKSVMIPCPYKLAKTEQLATLAWKKGNKDIQIFALNKEIYRGNFSRMFVDNNTRAMTLINVQFDDAGEYFCSVLTSKGSSTRAVRLRVYAVPEIYARALPLVLREDFQSHRKEETLAECVATAGSQPFSMKWVTYPGKKLIVGDNVRTESANPDNAQLVDAILPLSIPPDPNTNNGKKFSCVVEDAIGGETIQDVTADVRVLTTTPPTTTIQASPKVVSFPTEDGATIYAKIGERKQLTCDIAGVPSPKVLWYRSGKKVTEGSGSATVEMNIETLEDAGSFTCKGNNTEGEVSNSLQLIVHGAPVISMGNDVINGTENIAQKPEWKYVNLSCQALALPIADIRWVVEEMNSTDAIVDKRVVIKKNIVISTVYLKLFHENDEEKRVHCIASNSLGQSTRTFLVSNTAFLFASTGLIVGVVIGIVVILALMGVIVSFILSSRRRQAADVTSQENVEKGCLTCTAICGSSHSKKPANEKNEDTCEHEQTKGTSEEGTKEEKQKLTHAEEQPSKNDKETDLSKNGGSKDGAGDVTNPQKSRLSFSLLGFQTKKKTLKEEYSPDEQDTKQTEEKVEMENAIVEKDKTADADSGKGDTLNKVI